ncbi:hypothetical protein IFM89_004427 [Coptis chinensis]|uniref:WIT1/2 N-terminal helical bundle domain-containing protein n=1 Tax=Coptis chinensis TaxID=261450 RepID=A0A835GW55_9MAGN|nr:hypothetical protein IFM89_004427 [Coptis chinensis]
MEDTTKEVSDIQVTKVDSIDSDVAHPIKVDAGKNEVLANGALQHKEKDIKEPEEENALEGEFIKVEKEALDVKDSPHTDETTRDLEIKPSVVQDSSSTLQASRDLLEAQEKTKELELELERLTGQVKHSDQENAHLKEEVLVTKQKLEETVKHCEELEVNQKRVEELILQTEEKYKSQISTLQETLQAQEAKHKELTDVKEAFDGLTGELENSKKKLQELEQDLQSSAGEAQKFEEQSKQIGSHAASETQKALEFERLLELAKASAKEMEDQVASIQEEVKDLYKKIAENQQLEEVLRNTTAELSAVQGEVELSKSQVSDLQKRFSSEEDSKNELIQELDMHKASETKMKEDILALESLFSSTKDDLKAKVTELEEINLKLHEEVETRQLVEGRMRTQEEHISSVQEELAKVAGEKVTLEEAVKDLKTNVLEMKELCGDLETKLKLSDENFSKADSLLSEALSNTAELEQKLKSLDELHQESGSVAATATQRSLDLEDIVQASNTATEEAKSHLREIETKLISAEQKNLELEQQLNMNQKLEAEVKLTELESALTQSASRNLELEQELQDVSEKCTKHEGHATSTNQRCLELEDSHKVSQSKVEDADRKVAELEMLVQTTNYRIKELEEQITTLETKYNDKDEEHKHFSGKASELATQVELFQQKTSLLEAELLATNEKEKELTESLNVTIEEKKKFEDVSNSSSEKLAEVENLLVVLQNELKQSQDKLESVEEELKVSGVRESEILKKFEIANTQVGGQGKIIEEATARISELESLHESVLKDSELKLQEATVNFSNRDTEANSLSEKLKIHEDQKKVYEVQVAEADERAASLKVEYDEASMKLLGQESIIEELKGKVLEAEKTAGQSLSDNEMLAETNVQLKSKIDELQELLSSVHVEKEATSQQLTHHMNALADLTDQHTRAFEVQSSTESRIKEAELQLQEAIERFSHKDLEAKDLTEKLNALESQIRIYEETTKEASAVAQSQKSELEEALLKIKHFESVVHDLQVMVSQFEKESEGLAVTNLKLNEELVVHQSKLPDSNKEFLQVSTIMEENNSLNNTYQVERKELQEMISKLQGESNEQKELEETLRGVVESLKAELAEKSVVQARVVELDQQLVLAETRLKEEVESIKAKASEKEAELLSKLEEHAHKLQDRDILDEKVILLQKDLSLAHAGIAEQKEADLRKEIEKDDALKNSLGELEAKSQQVIVLEKQVEELEQKLHLADAKSIEKDEEAKKLAVIHAELDDLKKKSSQTAELEKKIEELENKLKLASNISKEQASLPCRTSFVEQNEGVEVKSRDIGLSVSTPSKRKHKKRSSEATSTPTSSTSVIHAPTSEGSSAMNFKFIFGIALVSVIIGIILGKRY